MSMVANKMDAVSVNRVWEEHCKKENRILQLNETFKVTDPRRMDVLPEKPNRTVPMPNPDTQTMMAATSALNGLASLKDTDRSPTDRFALPVTGNMEYGFFHKIAPPKQNSMFNYSLTTCDVTVYANEYVKSNGGVGPYTTKLQ